MEEVDVQLRLSSEQAAVLVQALQRLGFGLCNQLTHSQEQAWLAMLAAERVRLALYAQFKACAACAAGIEVRRDRA